ncbi:phospholipase D family protein [Jeotgalibacillus sp. ET6]|uniref:phospholipase D family protein n=1 Tax=Jeotgalibacillus sp. ET6 TaxID=3037260 RepID=UPI0024187820|nr:phospholipase D family protein [Jeotgalibacillus sp. ET6]MDG5470403.1 phospholipase D family protein [Jeotgalibacillus sp. ET6]
MAKKKRHWSKKKRIYAGIFIALFFVILSYHQYKPLPEGVSYESETYKTDEVAFYRDLTFTQNGETVHDQEIFERVGQLINAAQDFVVIDMFLFDGKVSKDKGYPDLSGNLTNQLLEKREQNPDMPMVVITDPVNTGYYSYENEWLKPLEEAGIDVVTTNLDPLRDPTPLYSAFWRMGIQWFGQKGTGWLPNGFVEDGPKMTARSYLMMANVKANHRKAVITDQGAMILSANAHNESGFHSNVAFEVNGPIIQDMLLAEQAVIDLGNSNVTLPEFDGSEQEKGDLEVKYTTEGKTWHEILSKLKKAKDGDQIWMAMFYLSEREVLNELIAASERGAQVYLILDPNETAFGNKKTGLPNRPVVNELVEDSNGFIQIKWYDVKEEQFHPKMMMVKSSERSSIISGSTNFTKRNLVDYNLENNIVIEGPNDTAVMEEVSRYFRGMWNNEEGQYTVGIEEYQTTLSFWQRGIYFIQKVLGLTTY